MSLCMSYPNFEVVFVDNSEFLPADDLSNYIIWNVTSSKMYFLPSLCMFDMCR